MKDAISVENTIYCGTPDVNYIEGWIELKCLQKWPPKDRIVKIHHFTPQQRVWLIRRWLRGGNVYLLLCVGQEWLLFTGDIAGEFVGKVTREILIQKSLRHWPRGLDKKELSEWISRN